MRNLTACSLLFLCLASPLALADDENNGKDEDRYDPTYTSIRLTSVKADFSNIDRAFNLGFTLGINIPGAGVIPSNVLAAEIDLSSTLIPGENKGGGGLGGGNDSGGNDCSPLEESLGQCESGGGGGGDPESADTDDLRLNGVGIFLRARTPGEFFGMGRVGYRFVETTIDELNEEQSGSAWGLGIGYRYSKRGAVELTYTQYGSDLTFLSLAVSY